MAGFCSLWVWHKQTDEGKVVLRPKLRRISCGQMLKILLPQLSHLQTSSLEWHTPPPPFPASLFLAVFLPPSLSPSLPQIPPRNTEESWQNGRKHAQTGQGRIWCQQPRTIKGVKVLPSLNCSRSVKWEPKLFTSFSEQKCLSVLYCTPHTERPLRGSDKGQWQKSRRGDAIFYFYF